MHLRYTQTTPERLADAIVGMIGSEATWTEIPADGARRAAKLIYELAPVTSRQEQAPSRALRTVAPL